MHNTDVHAKLCIIVCIHVYIDIDIYTHDAAIIQIFFLQLALIHCHSLKMISFEYIYNF